MNADGQWQLTGNAAELYESVLVPTVFQPWATDLVELAGATHGEARRDNRRDHGARSQHGYAARGSLWEGPTPYTVAMSAAVERHAGPEEAATPRRSRLCADSDSVRHLIEDAGFRDARTRARTLTRRLPGIADFVLRHLAATPVAGAVAALSPGARAALAGEVSLALRPYADGDGIVFPEVVNVVTAVR